MEHRIGSGDRAAVVVEVGGGLRTFEVAGQEIIDGYAPGALPPANAGQVLAPWPNRIRDGRYVFDGVTHQLAISEPMYFNAIHGLVAWLPWTVSAKSTDSVTFACSLPPQPGYPWALDLTTTWSVGPDGLRATHTATNRSGTPAPFGLGAHPYVWLPGVSVDDVVLTVPGDRVLVVDARKLPIAASPVAGTDLDFRSGRRIGSLQLDTAFGPVSGASSVRLSTVDGSRAVTVWADGEFHWWQVFTADPLDPPRTRRSLSVEPMTCPPDAYRSGKDLVILAPERTWRAEWGIGTTGLGRRVASDAAEPDWSADGV
jgi:aldose 1-epimerase